MDLSGNKEQPALNFDQAASSTKSENEVLKITDLKKIVLAWLAKDGPHGLAVNVPTRISKYKADIAAFWTVQRKKLFKPAKTMIIQVRTSKEHCWSELSGKKELFQKLKEMKDYKFRLQEKIKLEEPSLKDSDMLFEEYENWDFSKSRNKDYRLCCKHIEQLEHILYDGTLFEQIRRSDTAEYLYLAVPEGAMKPEDLADGWGLLYVTPQKKVKIVKEAAKWPCPEQNKFHLVQNIASASMKSVLMTSGIRQDAGGALFFTPVPRKRKGIKVE